MLGKYRNVGRAAQALHVENSGVTHHIKQLEKLSGVVLTRRTQTGIELTQAGERILQDAEVALSMRAKVSTNYRPGAHDDPAQTLFIGSSHGPAILLVQVLIAAFVTEFPPTCVDHKTRTSREIELLLKNREIEVGFVSNPSNDSAVIVEPIASERLLLVVAANNPIAKKSLISILELSKLPLLLGVGKDGTAPFIDTLKRRIGKKISLNIRMRYDNPGAIRAVVVAGAGVGVLFEDMVAQELQSGSVKELTIEGLDLRGQSYLAYLKGEVLSPVARMFIEFAQRYGEKMKSNKQKLSRLLTER